MTTNVMDSKQIPLDAKTGLLSPDVFTLLESQEIQTAEGIKQLIKENLSLTKESWLVHSLLDYYFLTQSKSVVGILCSVKGPHDKFLLEKLNDGIKSQERQLHALQLLLHIVCKQPLWLDKVVTCGVIKTIIKTLKTDASVPVLTTSVTIVTILLPSVPTLVGSYLPDLFEIFNKLASYSIKKPPGNTPDIFHLHLQIAVYGLFHRLYGMFPYNLLSYFRQYFHKKEHTQVFEEVIKHMLERVRLHPKLVTVTDKEHEISAQMWRQLETHDIVVECNKMSLDPVEGIWEELQCPIVAARYFCDRTQSTRELPKSEMKPRIAPATGPLSDTSNLGGTDVYWSPSEIIGLSTPPPTPVSNLESSGGAGQSHNVTPAVVLNTSMTPLNTPVDTPPISDDHDKVSSRSGSRSGVRLSMENKRLSCELTLQPVPLLTPSSHIPSIPPSPLKAEFTNTPPLGVKTLPVINAARELQFDQDPSEDNNQSDVTKINQSKAELSKHMTKVDQSESSTISENTNLSTEKGFSRSGSTSGFESSLNDSVPTDVKARSMSVGSGVSRSDTVSVDTISQVIEGLERQTSHDDDDDEEVSNLTSHSRSNLGQPLTSESVKKFMKSVNRIRFNSLTATKGVESEHVKFKSKRSRSCPTLPKIETLLEDDDETLSRSVSASCEDSTHSEINFTAEGATSSSETETSSKTVPAQEGTDNVSVTTTNSTITVNTKTETTVKITTTQSTEVSASKCPMASRKSDIAGGNEEMSDLMKVMREVLNLSSSYVCSKCQGQMTDSQMGTAKPFFSTFSPPELLDRHITLGRDIHAKELSKLPIPANQDVNWTHFGGVPPADEMSILRGQLTLLHNQLMYERHKRDQHAKRNRRLLRKIAHTTTLEEQNRAMNAHVQQQDLEIHNLKDSLKILEAKNRQLQEGHDEEEYEKLVQLKTCLQENEDLKSVKKELNMMLIKQREEQDQLTKKLKSVEAQLFNKGKEAETLQEVRAVNTKMKEQILQLQKEVLLMGELQQKCNEKLLSSKVSRATKLEHEKLVGTLENELKEVRQDRASKTVLLESCQQQLREQQELLTNKETALQEIKLTMEKIKMSHSDELKSVEDKCVSALRVNQTLEAHILQLNMELETEKSKHYKGGMRTTVSSEIAHAKFDEAPEEFRERTNSDPLQKSPAKKKLTRMTSLPVSSYVQPSRSLENSQRSLDFSGYHSSLKEEDFEVLDARSHDIERSDDLLDPSKD